MMFDVFLTEQADSDLRGIFEYIAFNLQSVQSASGQLDRLEESISKLDQMPERFRKYEREPWCGRNLRIMPVNNYCVLYTVDNEKKQVAVIRVMYGGRDIETQMSEHT